MNWQCFAGKSTPSQRCVVTLDWWIDNIEEMSITVSCLISDHGPNVVIIPFAARNLAQTIAKNGDIVQFLIKWSSTSKVFEL